MFNRATCAEMVIHNSRRKCQVVMPHLLPDVARVQSMKCAEMVIHNSRRKCQVVMPHLLPDVARVQSMKVLSVTINCNLSVLDHVNNIIRSSAQTIHALRILRAHGMADSSLHVVYRAVVVARLTYAASAWWALPLLLTVNA